MAAPDPAGVFRTDSHRRVLGHLSLPTEAFGWSLPALVARIARDPHTPDDDLAQALVDLVADGYAELVNGAYRQTTAGHAALTGPIADEPGPDPDPSLIRPALLGGPITDTGPTEIPVGATEVQS